MNNVYSTKIRGKNLCQLPLGPSNDGFVSILIPDCSYCCRKSSTPSEIAFQNSLLLLPGNFIMKREVVHNLNLWQFDNLGGQPAIKHFVTDRNSAEREFTLSLSSLPDKEKVRGHRRQLATALGISPDHLFLPSQIHGTTILEVTLSTTKESLHNTDALMTTTPGVCIAVMSADCVPILLYDKRNHVAAAVHSGWRGTVARILEKTLEALKERYGTRGDDIVAGIGPSVSQDSYEVGEEVIGEVQRSFALHHELLLAQPLNKAKLDLWKANRLQLHEFGVPEHQIETSGLCTVKNNNYFFSARKGDSGRFAAGIMLL
jgi:polyphenol oxidase